MRPEDKKSGQLELFERPLNGMVNKSHPLVKLSEKLDWERFSEKFGASYCLDNGRPGVPTRVMVGLTYLKYLNDMSDEQVLLGWVENPYWQYFCGEIYFQHKFPCDRSSLSKWRKRIGEEGAREFLEESLAVAKEVGVLKMSYLKELYCDTTVQEKNICYPSEANLLNRARKKLVKLAKMHGIELRQAYTRVGKVCQIMAHRYAAAQQWNRARRQVRKLRTYLRRTVRNIEKRLEEVQKPYFSELLELSHQLLEMPKGGEKLYSLHEPHVEAIAKGKMHKRFEYGVKVAVTMTRRKGFVLDCSAIHGNPYDGHTLEQSLENAEKIVGAILRAKVGVDLGYRGHGVIGRHRVYHPKLKRLSRLDRLFIRARSAVEASISFMKRCFRLGRNYLKGKLGDVMNSLFAGSACNLSHVLRAYAT
jgi:transposase, IS5 family